MPGWPSTSLSSSDRVLLRHLQRRALNYFLDNQLPNGLVLDRQSNHGPSAGRDAQHHRDRHGPDRSIAASASPYRLITEQEAIDRVRTSLETGLDRIPVHHGVMPHFVDRETLVAVGEDAFRTVDTSWFLAGALWSAAFLNDPYLVDLADQISRGLTGGTG